MIFHYTTLEGAQGISLGQVIEPGRSGSVWVTPELYDRGAEAANRLAIMAKAVSRVVAMDLAGLPPATNVIPVRLGGGLRREGGGLEIKLSGSVSASMMRFLQLNEP